MYINLHVRILCVSQKMAQTNIFFFKYVFHSYHSRRIFNKLLFIIIKIVRLVRTSLVQVCCSQYICVIVNLPRVNILGLNNSNTFCLAWKNDLPKTLVVLKCPISSINMTFLQKSKSQITWTSYFKLIVTSLNSEILLTKSKNGLMPNASFVCRYCFDFTIFITYSQSSS